MSAPRSLPEQESPPSRSSTLPPRARMAARCRSMGRGPSSQPPGAHSRACPIRPRMAPRKMTEERISRIRASGTSQRLGAEASTTTPSPCHSALQPRWRRMAREASTSERRGQFWITQAPGANRQAARMGSTLFFAPWTITEPSSGRPPSITYALIASILRIQDLCTPSYASDGRPVHFARFSSNSFSV